MGQGWCGRRMCGHEMSSRGRSCGRRRSGLARAGAAASEMRHEGATYGGTVPPEAGRLGPCALRPHPQAVCVRRRRCSSARAMAATAASSLHAPWPHRYVAFCRTSVRAAVATLRHRTHGRPPSPDRSGGHGLRNRLQGSERCWESLKTAI
jgi:hypothetical protein